MLLHKTDTTRYITALCDVCFLLLLRVSAPSYPQALDLGVARPIVFFQLKTRMTPSLPLFSASIGTGGLPVHLVIGEREIQRDLLPQFFVRLGYRL